MRVVWLSLLMLCSSCKDNKQEDAPAGPPLVPRKVPNTALVVSLPRGWTIQMPDPGPLPPAPGDGAKLQLASRLVMIARPESPTPGMLVAPVLHVFEDPWLPVGTTGVDYLVAQRTANQAAIGANIRHVDAEPSRRNGRPSYHVRDEWTVLGPSGSSRDVSQEALLVLDAVKTPEGKDAMRGYTVVVTMEKAEFATLQPVVRAIINAVRFDDT